MLLCAQEISPDPNCGTEKYLFDIAIADFFVTSLNIIIINIIFPSTK
jgi:hypothetical protein